MKDGRVFLVCVFTLFVCVSLTSGRELRVGAGGSYVNIKSAVNSAVDGDVVIVADGTYTGNGNRNINIVDKSITVRSENGPDNCIVDCEFLAEYVFRFEKDSDRDESEIFLDGFTIIRCRVGGIKIFNSSPTIKNCVISDCWGMLGEAVLYVTASKSLIQNCRIINNSVSQYGNIILIRLTDIELRDCEISGNTNVDEDIIEVSLFGTVAITNCVFARNHSSDYLEAGLLEISGDSKVTILNSVFIENNYSYQLIGFSNVGHVEIRNSIFRSNTYKGERLGHRVISSSSGNTVLCSHNIFEGGIDAVAVESEIDLEWGEGNKDVDPMLTRDFKHLLWGSPCIDGGDPDFDISTLANDIDGEARVHGGRVDIGPDEFIDSDSDELPDWFEELVSGSITDAEPDGDDDGDRLTNIEEYFGGRVSDGEADIYVDSVGGNDGWSGITAEWDGSDGPKRTIQGAINSALEGDLILVSQGIYNERIGFNGKNVSLVSTNPDDSGVVASTVIDGGANGTVVTFGGGEDESCVLEGFTVTGGSNGGIQGNGSMARVSKCVIRDNSKEGPGGGIHYLPGEISGCLITGNLAFGGGGLGGCHGVIRNCVISYNLGFAGMGLNNCDGEIVNCTIVRNFFDPLFNPTLEDYISIENCNGTITNCIAWIDAWGIPSDIKDQITPFRNCSTPTYSCFNNADGSNGNIAFRFQPELVYFDNGDCRLSSAGGYWDPESQTWIRGGSFDNPCIDSGDPMSDWSGELWPNGFRINMGAYGGTAQASKSISDAGNPANMKVDEVIDFSDFSILSNNWRAETLLSVADIDRDGEVGFSDLVLFADSWLGETGSPEFLGYWPFDGRYLTIASNESSYNFDGTLLNMSERAWVTGKVGNALSFDGVDDRVQVYGYKGMSGAHSRTVSAWIKTTDTSGEIISWGTNDTTGGMWVLLTQVSGFLRLEVGGGAIVGSTFICDGKWHHVAAVLDSDGTPYVSDVVLYVDGFPDVFSKFTDQIVDTMPRSDVKIGFWGAGQRFFDGLIDEVRIYGRALTMDEIGELVGIKADAGADVSVEPDADGSGVANLAGRVISYDTSEVEWSLVSGPGDVVFDDAGSPVTTAVFSGEGEYVLRLTVVDGDDEVSDEVTITVRSVLPMGVWSFDGMSGNVAVDSSDYLRDGTLLNMDDGAWVAGKADNCLSFDGVNDLVRVYGFPGIDGSNSRSFCAWIKTFDTSGEIVSWGANAIPGGRWVFLTQADGFLRLEVGSGAVVGSTVVCDGEWHHVGVVLEDDGSPNVNEIKLYVDGVLDEPSIAGDREINTILEPDVKIGVYSGGLRFFEGLIDEVRIYDRALSAEEILN